MPNQRMRMEFGQNSAEMLQISTFRGKEDRAWGDFRLARSEDRDLHEVKVRHGL